MAINTGNFAKLLYPGLNDIYGHKYNEFPLECAQIFEEKNTTRAYEEEIGVTGFGMAPIKGEGNSVTFDTEQQGFLSRYTPVVYSLGFIITEEMMDDDLYDTVGQRRTEGLAFSMRQTKETVGANFLNRAFNAAYKMGDGASLVSSLHPNVSGGTWSNAPTTAADLSVASLEQAVIDIGKFTDDRGKRIQVMPKQLIVPIDLKFEAERILESVLQSGTADNDANVLRTMGSIPKIIVNHYLTDTDAWFVQTNIPNGLTNFMRKSATFSIDNDFDTSNAKFKAYERYSFGSTDSRGIYGSSGA